MVGFAARRLLQAIPVVFLTTVLIFLLLHLVPGDPAETVAGPDATPAQVQTVRRELGLDRPLPIQYVLWIGGVVHGDLGQSYVNHLPVRDLILQRIPATLELAIGAIVLELLIALPTGLLAAMHRRGVADWIISSFNALVLAVPNFWFAILAILLFALVLSWLPPGGYLAIQTNPLLGLKFLILPVVTLALSHAAVLSRYVKASVLDVLHQDYVRTARAKGLSDRVIMRRHVLRTALVPVATILGLQFGRMLGGVVIIEAVFAWPGIGSLLLDSVENRDYTVVQGTLLLFLIVFVLVNLLTDLTYGFIDPRIRLESGEQGS